MNLFGFVVVENSKGVAPYARHRGIHKPKDGGGSDSSICCIAARSQNPEAGIVGKRRDCAYNALDAMHDAASAGKSTKCGTSGGV